MIREYRAAPVLFVIFVLPAILILALGWANSRLVNAIPIAQRFDVHWQAMRQLALQGQSPYFQDFPPASDSTPVTSVGNVSFKRMYTAPLYSGLILLPFALIDDISFAKTAWLVILEISLIIITIFVYRVIEWQPGKLQFALFLLFSLFGYHSVQAFFSGDTVILSVLFITLGLNFLRDKKMELAGFLFAFATIQPRLTVLPVIFLLIWAISNRYWNFVVWFFGSLGFFFILGLFIIPDWPIQYFQVLWRFREQYNFVYPLSALNALIPGIGRQLGAGMMLISGALLIIEWSIALKKGFNWFLWIFCLTLILNPWIGIPTNAQDYVILVIPMGLILSLLDKRMLRVGKILDLAILVSIFTGWWLLFNWVAAQNDPFRLHSLFMILNPFVSLGLIYWVRWWATRSTRSLLSDLRSSIE